ncbi:MAG: type IV pilus twitching motility protein PilT [Candidatus Omnitrophica bacterium]|nr:type IV pilus twitching motility protein PilT [Candidatus Omnitrophota bacterium]
MEQLLQLCVQENASDIHIAVGRPPTLRIHGSLQFLDCEPLKPEDTERLMKSITTEEQQQRFKAQNGVDFGFPFHDLARFRVSVFRQKHHIGIVLRLIPSRLLNFEDIGLPPGIKDILHKPRGLILVTGPTGSGKTTTLASMIDYINSNRDCHIVTIEDPIEYYHVHKKSIVTQREIGADVPSFKEALVRGLRMDPDVFLVGEMRDLDTISAAITAAETGHLVFATLHTVSAKDTVDRVIDVFPTEQQDQIRVQLSTSILAIFSQQLIPKVNGKGRVAVIEIMISTPSIQNLIREGKTFRITSDIQTGAKYGMRAFDAALFECYQKGLIDYGEMISKAFDPDQLQTKLQEGTKRR